MSLQKMEMVNMVGRIDQLDRIARKIVLASSVQMVNAFDEIKNNHFSILKASRNVGAVIDYSNIHPYQSTKDLAKVEEQLLSLANMLGITYTVKRQYDAGDYSFTETAQTVNKLYRTLSAQMKKYEQLQKDLAKIEHLKKYFVNIKDIDILLSDVVNMQYIRMRIGKIAKNNIDQLKKYYSRISAIVLKVNEDKDFQYIMIFYPEYVHNEVERLLKYTHFHELVTDFNFEEKPGEIWKAILAHQKTMQKKLDQLKAAIEQFTKEHRHDLNKFYSRLCLEYEVEQLKSYVVCSNSFFYLTGWVPVQKKDTLEKLLADYPEDLSIVFKKKEKEKGPVHSLMENFRSRIVRLLLHRF